MRKSLLLMIVSAIGAAIPAGAIAGPFEDGLAAYQRGDVEEAFRLMHIAAESGHARAQYNVGMMYRNGSGVARDDAKAVKWFKLAAQQGHGASQFYIGEAYRLGEGVAKDEREALGWYRKSAAAPENHMASQAAFMAAALEAQVDMNRPR